MIYIVSYHSDKISLSPSREHFKLSAQQISSATVSGELFSNSWSASVYSEPVMPSVSAKRKLGIHHSQNIFQAFVLEAYILCILSELIGSPVSLSCNCRACKVTVSPAFTSTLVRLASARPSLCPAARRAGKSHLHDYGH